MMLEFKSSRCNECKKKKKKKNRQKKTNIDVTLQEGLKVKVSVHKYFRIFFSECP